MTFYDHVGSSFMRSVALELKGQLELLTKVRKLNQQPAAETKATLIKETVQEFIETSLRAGASENEVKKVLSELYSSDLLLSEDIYKWALSEVSTAAQAVCLKQTFSTSEKVPPLFCKETLYHASLCCYAVSNCDANTYQKFFNKDFPNHSLEEASFSRSRDRERVDRYLIARHDKTYYVAFQSEPLLAQWPKFTSFQEGTCVCASCLQYWERHALNWQCLSLFLGIKIQSERTPLRFFVQQMLNGYHIVFTGMCILAFILPSFPIHITTPLSNILISM